MFHSTSVNLFSNMNYKNPRMVVPALAVVALLVAVLAGCATPPDVNGHVDITGTSIAGSAFYTCTTLTSVTIADTVKSIGDVRSSRPPFHSSIKPAG